MALRSSPSGARSKVARVVFNTRPHKDKRGGAPTAAIEARVFAAAVIIFAAQNLQIVPISFLGFSAEVRLALLAAGIYLVGAFTGGSLLALLRQSIEGAQRRTAGTL